MALKVRSKGWRMEEKEEANKRGREQLRRTEGGGGLLM